MKCKKCKFELYDMSDGCSICKPFKDKHILVDDDGDNAVTWELNETRKLIRNELEHLTHARKVTRKREGADYFDPSLVDAVAKLAKAQREVCQMLGRIQKDAAATIQKMNVSERNELLITYVRMLPKPEREKFLLLAAETEGQEPKPIMKPYRTDGGAGN